MHKVLAEVVSRAHSYPAFETTRKLDKYQSKFPTWLLTMLLYVTLWLAIKQVSFLNGKKMTPYQIETKFVKDDIDFDWYYINSID